MATKRRHGGAGELARGFGALLAVMVFGASLVVASAPRSGAASGPHRWIVSLGDSYTAGTGAGNYYGQIPGNSSNCYRSYDSYPWRYTAKLVENGYNADIWHAACNGNVLSDIAGQIDQVVNRSPVGHDADMVLLTIGGNDFKFSDIVLDCLVPAWNIVRSILGYCQGDMNYAMDVQDAVFAGTKDALLAAGTAFPRAQIVLLGYPHLTSPGCASPVDDVLRSLQSSVDATQQSIVEGLDRANATVRYKYINVSPSFEARGPCQINSGLMNYLKVPGLLDTNESFHPKKAGHQLEADLLWNAGWHKAFDIAPPINATADLTILATEATTGTPFTFAYTIRNNSNYSAILNSIVVHLHTPVGARIDLPCGPSTGTIAAGGVLKCNASYTFAAAGTYQVGISFEDASGNGYDRSRTNINGTFNVAAAQQPTTFFATLWSSSAVVIQGQPVTMFLSLRNGGSNSQMLTSINTVVQLPDGTRRDLGCNPNTSAVAAGATFTCSVTATFTQLGDYSLGFTLAANGGTAGFAPARMFTVKHGAMTVGWNMSTSAPEGLYPRKTITLIPTLYNLGTVDGTLSEIVLFVRAPDGTVRSLPCSKTTMPLPPGSNSSCPITASFDAVGNYQIGIAFMDDSGYGYNTNRATFSNTLEVGPAPLDVAVSADLSSASGFYIGALLTARLNVTNTGSSTLSLRSVEGLIIDPNGVRYPTMCSAAPSDLPPGKAFSCDATLRPSMAGEHQAAIRFTTASGAQYNTGPTLTIAGSVRVAEAPLETTTAFSASPATGVIGGTVALAVTITNNSDFERVLSSLSVFIKAPDGRIIDLGCDPSTATLRSASQAGTVTCRTSTSALQQPGTYAVGVSFVDTAGWSYDPGHNAPFGTFVVGGPPATISETGRPTPPAAVAIPRQPRVAVGGSAAPSPGNGRRSAPPSFSQTQATSPNPVASGVSLAPSSPSIVQTPKLVPLFPSDAVIGHGQVASRSN